MLVTSVIYGASVNKVTGDLKLYASKMAEKAEELKHEKLKTDNLLYQMLPRTVADRLKANMVRLTTCSTRCYRAPWPTDSRLTW